MSTVTVSGSSDDRITIEGDIDDEFYQQSEDIISYLACSDGTILRIVYDDGCWRITRSATGSAKMTKVEAEGWNTPNYSDRVTLTGAITWVVVCDRVARAQ